MSHHVFGKMRLSTWVLAVGTVGAGLLTQSTAHAGISNRELVEVVDIDSLSISPDGTFAVFRSVRGDIGRNSYIIRWHSVDLRNETVRDIGSGGNPIYMDPGSVQPETPAWTEGGRTIVFRALVEGAVSLWQADVIGRDTAPLLVRDADIEEYSASDGGRAIIYKTGPSRAEIRRAETKEYDSGILVDSSVDLSQALFRGGSINGRMATQRLVGYWVIRDQLLWRSPRQRRRYDLMTHADTAVEPPKPVPAFAFPGSRPPLQATSKTGDLAEATWDGKSGSVSVTFANGQKLICEDPLCASVRVAALVWRPGSTDLVITVMDRERRQSLHLWTTETNRLRRIAHSDGLLSGGRRHMQPCAVSAVAAVCVTASPASPPRVERIDLERGERRVLFDPNANLRSAYLPLVRYLRWRIDDSHDAAGVLLRSATSANGPAPLYINYYSCEGFLRGGEGDEWPIPQLLDAGFIVVCINAVPSTGPQDAVEEYRTGFSAVRALVEKLSGEGFIDPSKVAMGGLSFGSEVTMWTATHSRLLAAASVASAQFEPTSFWSDAVPGSDRPELMRKVWGLGEPDETPQRWRLTSAALNAEKIRVPVLFQLPEQEARRMPELHARLAKAGTPVELYAFPNEAHIKVQPRHRLAVYERNLDWFRYWVQDFSDPNPDKAEQYRRWDQLRQRRTAASATTTKPPARVREP